MPRTTLFSIMRRQWRVWLPLLAVTLAVAGWLESRSLTYHEASGTVLLVEADPGRSASASAAVSTISIVDRVTDSDVAQDIEERGHVFGAYRVDTRTFQLFVTAERERDVEGALDDVLDWLVRDIDEGQADAGVAADQRVTVQPRFLDPATWQLADGRYATGAEVTLRDTSGADNPYGATGGTWRLLQIAATSDQGQALLGDRIADHASFRIGFDRRDAAPVATISVGAIDAASALAAFDTVAAFLADELEDRQRRAGVAAERRHTIEVIGRPISADRTDSVPSEPALLTFVVGSVAALGLAATVDWMGRRGTGHGLAAPLPTEEPRAPARRDDLRAGPGLEARQERDEERSLRR